MLKPHHLAPGDRVAIVAPASPFNREEFENGLVEVRELGFDPVFDQDIFERQGYVAGRPEQRAAQLRRAWCDGSVRGILSVRGGYGSVQILPFLQPENLRRTPKVFVGYSDLTSLLAFLGTSCGIVSFHGPTVAGQLSGGQARYDRDSFVRCLMGREAPGEFAPSDLENLKSGETAGPLFGGTLTQLTASLGTPYAFAPPTGFVLFVDEVGERPYRLDRMWTQLRFSGLLARAAAIVFGELPGCDEPGGTPSARSTARALVADFPGPVLFGFPSGHTAGAGMTLPLGVHVRVIAGARPRVVIEEAAVA